VRRGFNILLALTALLAVLLAVNTIVTDSQTESAKADGGRIVDLPGGDLQVREDGPATGPPVVLIHGWAASIHWWGRITPLLAGRDRVIRVDLLGHGGSAKPRNGYSIEEQADRVALALTRLRVRRALLVGHSAGGAVATALAARHPELARRLVLIDSKPAERFVSPDFLAKLSVTRVIGEALKRLATDGAIRDGLEQGFAKGFPVPDQFVHDFNKLTYSAYKKTYDESGDYVDEGHLERDIRAIHVPKLVIFGAEDQLVEPPDEAAAEFRKLGVATRLVQGAGHSPMVEKPAETARLLLSFDRSEER
jgi:pimeloyl-ACP methyl ester carboxylesterase